MANDETEKRIVISIDEAAKNKTLKAFAEIGNAGAKTKTALERLGEAGRASAKKIADAQKEQIRLSKESGAQLEKQVRSLLEVKDAADKAADSLNNAGRAGAGGSIGGQVADIRGAISSVSGGGASAGLELASGIGDAVEAFGSLNPAVAASTIAITALSFVMNSFTESSRQQAQVLNSVIDAQRSVNEAVIAGLNTEEARARLEELERLAAAEEALLAENQAKYNAALDGFAEQTDGFIDGILGAFGGIGGLDASPVSDALLQQISEQEQALADQIKTSEANITSYNAEIAALNTQLENGNIAANDTAAAEAELAETREAEAQRAIQAAEQAAQQIARLEQQRSDLIANRAIAESNANAVSALEAKFAREDEKAEAQAHVDNLAAIAKQGQQRIEQIQSEINALLLEQAKALADIQAKGNAELQKLDSDYFAEQIKATKDFAKEQGRIASDTAKAAKRLAEDIADNLADAVRDNDVVAFLQIQRDGQKDLKRNAEDAKEEERRRTEDFLQGQEEQRQAFEQSRQEILAGIEAERTKALQSFAERRAALEQQILNERAATGQALANARARYQQEEALEDQAASRNAQRLALRQQQEDAAFARQLANIQSRIAAENAAYAAAAAGISRIAAQAAALGSNARSTVATSASNVYSRITGGSSSLYSGAPSYANKGGMAGVMGAAANLIVNNTNYIGDIATTSQVSAALAENNQSMFGAVMGAFQKAQG